MHEGVEIEHASQKQVAIMYSLTMHVSSVPRRLSDHLVGCKLSLTSVYLHRESKPHVRLSADEQVFTENILHSDN